MSFRKSSASVPTKEPVKVTCKVVSGGFQNTWSTSNTLLYVPQK